MAATGRSAELIRSAFLELTEDYIRRGANVRDLRSVLTDDRPDGDNARSRDTIDTARRIRRRSCRWRRTTALLIAPFLYVILGVYLHPGLNRSLRETRCLLPNNYLVWEFTRPLTDCDYCRDIDAPLILPNLTREEFRAHSYSSRPMIAKGAARDWRARDEFTLEYFRDLYEGTESAYESMDEECQFLRLKSDFASLREVFAMSERRSAGTDEPWYVGWKNCHPRILDAMARYYSAPHFLPEDAEIPYSNYVFLGYEEGAVMHLDYISRLMWQAQVIGSKTWTVAPTPECNSVCRPFKFSVDVTDVVLLDTRIWYHGTYVENGNLSLTITSEYG